MSQELEEALHEYVSGTLLPSCKETIIGLKKRKKYREFPDTVLDILKDLEYVDSGYDRQGRWFALTPKGEQLAERLEAKK